MVGGVTIPRGIPGTRALVERRMEPGSGRTLFRSFGGVSLDNADDLIHGITGNWLCPSRGRALLPFNNVE